jgi:serine/threonine protein kinase
MIVMEYLDGQPLSKLLEAGPLPLAQTAAIARQVALGMAAAHERGIVHGDLKPANVMVTTAGIAKILDFGLASRQRQAADGSDSDGARGLLGTPGYMSPEQSRGQPISPASDVFSLGLILYEMLTGRPVITSTKVLEMVRSIASLDAEHYAAAVDSRFSPLLRQALVVDGEKRTLGMTELATTLERIAMEL